LPVILTYTHAHTHAHTDPASNILSSQKEDLNNALVQTYVQRLEMAANQNLLDAAAASHFSLVLSSLMPIEVNCPKDVVKLVPEYNLDAHI